MLDVAAHLKAEITAPDPWRLQSNPFEHRRYAVMLNMIRAHGRVSRALEIGCAAGVFSELLAPLVESLHIVDVMPDAIGRTLERLSERENITCEVASVAENFAAGETYDLIVVAEVLCYLPDAATLQAVIERLSRRLRPGGLLVFGSAVDETCSRWGLTVGGAETAAQHWAQYLRETSRIHCQGSYWGEDCWIVSYTRDVEAFEQVAPTHVGAHELIPFNAVKRIEARSAVVLAPHPDDEVLGCGGAIMRHQAADVPLRVIIVTDHTYRGEGGPDLWQARRHESCEAAALLGSAAPKFWDFADKTLSYSTALIDRIAEAIGDADLVYAPSVDELHPDHRAVGMAAAEAVRRRGGDTRIAFYEISAPLKPNVLLDISEIAERKVAAIRCFRSQLSKQRYDAHAAALNVYRTYTLPPTVTAAEAYLVVSAGDLAADPLLLHRSDIERRLADTTLELRDARMRIDQMESMQRERVRIMRELIHGAEAHAERTRLQAEHSLAIMRASTSWRITAPMRALALFVHRLRNRAARPSP